MATRRICYPEVQMLVNLSATLHADYAAADLEWEGSPFAWIKRRPSRQRGAIGERLVAGWCAAKGLDVTRAPDSQCDRMIAGLRTEIKFSTLWKQGNYVFQQFRDQNYQIAICLGVSPFDAHCWVIPKAQVMKHIFPEAGRRAAQHGGANGRDTGWVHIDPASRPKWMSKWGGELADAFRVLKRLAAGA